MTNNHNYIAGAKPADIFAAQDHTDEVYDAAAESADLTRLLMAVDANPTVIAEAMIRTMMDYAVLSYIVKPRDE